MNSYIEELQRRRRAVERVVTSPLLLAGYSGQQRAADMAHQFTQEASFFWLTGIDEPDWRAAFIEGKLSLIAPKRDEVHQLFDGGLSDEEALKVSGAAQVISHDDAGAFLKKLALKYKKVYTIGKDPHARYYHFEENSAPKRLRRELKQLFGEVDDMRPELSKLRAIKSDYEVAQIQAAIDVSIEGFTALKEQLTEGPEYEYELEATLNSAFRKTGAAGHAYEPIVASGKHACTLHYAVNNDRLLRDTMVLIDAGAKVAGYAADITRTYATGTPTKRQKEIHTAVQKAHYKIIDCIKPGVALKQYQAQVDDIMKDALASVGLLKDLNDNDTYRKYFPHAIGHGLGIDVHESLGGYGEFMSGMVLTVEPGIYIPEEGIGIRIEDDILVTENGNRNLSGALATNL